MQNVAIECKHSSPTDSLIHNRETWLSIREVHSPFRHRVANMLLSTHPHITPLGWLPTSLVARRDGFLPVYRRLRQDGSPIIDDWGFLTPDLYWRHGRGYGDSALEATYALELLMSSADAAQPSPRIKESLGSLYKWSPAKILGQDTSVICLRSPALPDRLTRSAWLKALPELAPPRLVPRLAMLTRDPARLLRAGYQMLCFEWADHGPGRRQTAEALSIIGLSALGLFPRVRCSVCYRISMPASGRCARHSQTKAIRVDPSGSKLHSMVSAEARLAGRVMKRLGWSRTAFRTDLGDDFTSETKTFAGILWGLNTHYGGHTLSHLKELLRIGRFPRVRALLPGNFLELDDVRACAALRLHIDANEWVPTYWLTRVAAAEFWFEAAEALSPGRTHMRPSEANRDRVEEARSLIQQGIPKKEIALQLGISPSHRSHLLQRMK